MSPAFAGSRCGGQSRPAHGRVRGAAADGRFSKKGPVIGDGSQSREKRQSKSIRGSAMCHNSHTERETLGSPPPYEAPLLRNRAARH